MKSLFVAPHHAIFHEIQNVVSRSPQLRYLHQLHALLLIAKGVSVADVSELLGQDRRTLERLVRRYEVGGLEAVQKGAHFGRPSVLTQPQWMQLAREVGRPPRSRASPQKKWSGQLLHEYLKSSFHVELGLRQCQRLLNQVQLTQRLGLDM